MNVLIVISTSAKTKIEFIKAVNVHLALLHARAKDLVEDGESTIGFRRVSDTLELGSDIKILESVSLILCWGW